MGKFILLTKMKSTMKKSNLLIIICCFLLCYVTSYAQHHPNSGQYSNGELQFEFELGLIYSDNSVNNADTYDAERVLDLSARPLDVGHSDGVFIPLTNRGWNNVITIWPLVDSNKSSSVKDAPYVTTIIPSKRNESVISGIEIYPNPTQGNLYIEMPGNQTFNQIGIYNKTGQSVKIFNGIISDLVTLDLKGLSPDVYFIIIRNERGQIIHQSKLIFDK